MKRNLFFLAVLFTVLSVPVLAQTENKELIKDVLTKSDMRIVWLGADFSHVKILDSLGCTPERFATEIIPAINNIVIMEPSKYDFGKFLQKITFFSDTEAVTKSNKSINPEEMVKNTQEKLDVNKINNIVGSYNLKEKEGIGVVLIYEALSKKNLYSSMYFTYVKMPEGKVILTKYVSARPGGFGLRNFWAATIYDFLKDYNKVYLKSLKAEYGIK